MFGMLRVHLFNDFSWLFNLILKYIKAKKSIIFVVPESLSKHYKNAFWRAGQARTTQTKARPDKTRQDEAKEGRGGNRATLCEGGRGLSNPKGGTPLESPPFTEVNFAESYFFCTFSVFWAFLGILAPSWRVLGRRSASWRPLEAF